MVWFDGDFEATTRFVAPARQIVVSIGDDWEPAKNGISIRSTSQSSILPGAKIETKFLGNRVNLVVFTSRIIHADNFLEGDDVGIDLLQDFRNPFRPHLAVEPLALMNVVSCNAKRKHPG